MAAPSSFCFRCLDTLSAQQAPADATTEQPAALACGHAAHYHVECLLVQRRSGQSCPCQNSKTPACSVLAHVLHATRSDKTFQANGFRAMASMASQSTEVAQELLDLDLFAVVCDGLGNYPSELLIQRCGHQALHAFLSLLKPDLVDNLLSAGFCPKVCWSMSRFPEDQELAIAAMHVIGDIALAEPAASVHLFELSEGPRLVCEAAKQWMQNPAMQKAALDAIHGLAWGLETGSSQLMEKRAPRILLEVMARNGSDRAMIKLGLRTISNMAPGPGADQVGADGGCALLTKLMSKYGEDTEMLAAILEALGSLTANSAANRTRMGTEASVTAIMKVINAAPRDAGVQLQGSRLICFISQDKAAADAKERFGMVGCCATLLRTLGDFGRAKEREMLLWCTRAMMALISYCPANQARFREAGAEALLMDLARSLAASSQEPELAEAMQVVLGGLGGAAALKDRSGSNLGLGSSPTAPATASGAGANRPAVPKIGQIGKSSTSPCNLTAPGPMSARKPSELKRQNSARRDSESILARARAELAKMQQSGGGPAMTEEQQQQQAAGDEAGGATGAGKMQWPVSARGGGGRQMSQSYSINTITQSLPEGEPDTVQDMKGVGNKSMRAKLHLQMPTRVDQQQMGVTTESMDGAGMMDAAKRTDVLGTYGDTTTDGSRTARQGSLLMVTARRQGSRSMIVVDPTIASFTTSAASPNAVPPLSGIAKAISSSNADYAAQASARQAPMTARGSGMASLGTLPLAATQDPALLTARGGAGQSAVPLTARGLARAGMAVGKFKANHTGVASPNTARMSLTMQMPTSPPSAAGPGSPPETVKTPV